MFNRERVKLPPHLRRGRLAERLACRFLRGKGLRLLSTNYRSPYGEIDLVMEAGDTLVFVEVRYRNNRRYGGALESVDPRKQGRLRRSAQYWLLKHPVAAHRPCRFDVVALTREPGAAPQIQWVPNAF